MCLLIHQRNVNSLIFYPIFCFDCMKNWVSKKEIERCIFCGSDNTVGHRKNRCKDKANVIQREPKASRK